MKKLIGIFLSIAMLLGLSATALASTPPDTPSISPTGIVYPQETVSSATGFFRGTDFSCTSNGGDSLRYWFQNTGTTTCTVSLYKKTFLSYSLVSSMTVSPSDPGGNSKVYRNCGTSTYYLYITSANGAPIHGYLKAAQRNYSEM